VLAPQSRAPSSQIDIEPVATGLPSSSAGKGSELLLFAPMRQSSIPKSANSGISAIQPAREVSAKTSISGVLPALL